MEKNENLESKIQSEKLLEIISRPPSWMIKWGISAIVLSSLTILVIVSILKTRQLLKGNIELLQIQSPKTIIGKRDAVIEEYFVKNGDNVKQGQILVVARGIYEFRDLLKVKKNLSLIVDSDFNSYNLPMEIPANYNGALINKLKLLNKKYKGFIGSNLSLKYSQGGKSNLKSVAVLQKEKSDLIESIHQTIVYIENLENEIVYRSPCNGKLFFSPLLSKYKAIILGKEIFEVVPDRTIIVGSFEFDIKEHAKIEPGQSVMVELGNDISTLIGKIDTILPYNKKDLLIKGFASFENQEIIGKFDFDQGMKTEVLTNPKKVRKGFIEFFRSLVQ